MSVFMRESVYYLQCVSFWLHSKPQIPKSLHNLGLNLNKNSFYFRNSCMEQFITFANTQKRKNRYMINTDTCLNVSKHV